MKFLFFCVSGLFALFSLAMAMDSYWDSAIWNAIMCSISLALTSQIPGEE